MSKKLYMLIQGVIGGVAAIASAIVTYFNPAYAAAIVAGIGIGSTAVIEICGLFVRNDLDKISV